MFNFDPEKGIPDFDLEHEKFVNETASDAISKLSKEDKKALLDNPDPIYHHFGYGMYIRNRYIHNKELRFPVVFKDDLSSEIVEEIIRRLQEEANSYPQDKD